jgi:hypothetical protein
MEADTVVKQGARRAYERSRIGVSLRAGAFLAVLCSASALIGTQVATALSVSAAMMVAVTFMRFYGRSLARAVLPGALLGAIPFTLAMASKAYGHVCTGSGCMSLCVPACTLGGAVVGAALVLTARSEPKRTSYLLGGGALALLVGALGCSCVGYGGLLGMLSGMLALGITGSLAVKGRQPPSLT